MITQNKVNGFTFLEVMIVLVIIGIVATIATPAYKTYTLKANRSDAYAALNEIMQAQERFKADNGTYTEDLTALGFLVAQPSERGRYSITATACPAPTVIVQCVLLSAAAQGDQLNDKNDGLGNNIDITLDSRGTRAGW